MKELNCKECGQPMVEIGGIGKIVRDFKQFKDGKLVAEEGMREQKLYQCPKDKTITIL